MPLSFLEFEQPIAELEAKIAAAVDATEALRAQLASVQAEGAAAREQHAESTAALNRRHGAALARKRFG